jgi:hypothetical protein
MNKPYTCHLCSHEFDVWPDTDLFQRHAELVLAKQRIEEVPEQDRNPYPAVMNRQCPGCGESYTLNVQNDPPTLIT